MGEETPLAQLGQPLPTWPPSHLAQPPPLARPSRPATNPPETLTRCPRRPTPPTFPLVPSPAATTRNTRTHTHARIVPGGGAPLLDPLLPHGRAQSLAAPIPSPQRRLHDPHSLPISLARRPPPPDSTPSNAAPCLLPGAPSTGSGRGQVPRRPSAPRRRCPPAPSPIVAGQPPPRPLPRRTSPTAVEPAALDPANPR